MNRHQIERLRKSKENMLLTTDSSKFQQYTSFLLRHMANNNAAELIGSLILFMDGENPRLLNQLYYGIYYILYHESPEFQRKIFNIVQR